MAKFSYQFGMLWWCLSLIRNVFTILRNCREKRSAWCPRAAVIHINRLRIMFLFIGSVRLSVTAPEKSVDNTGELETPLSSKNRQRTTRATAIDRSSFSRHGFAALMEIRPVRRMSWLRAKETTAGRISWTMTWATLDFAGIFVYNTRSPCRQGLVSDPQMIVGYVSGVIPIPREIPDGLIMADSGLTSLGTTIRVMSSIREMSFSSVVHASSSSRLSQNWVLVNPWDHDSSSSAAPWTYRNLPTGRWSLNTEDDAVNKMTGLYSLDGTIFRSETGVIKIGRKGFVKINDKSWLSKPQVYPQQSGRTSATFNVFTKDGIRASICDFSCADTHSLGNQISSDPEPLEKHRFNTAHQIGTVLLSASGILFPCRVESTNIALPGQIFLSRHNWYPWCWITVRKKSMFRRRVLKDQWP